MKIWRCEYTGEFILSLGGKGGYPLFGSFLPFIGWKWIPVNADGKADNQTWPPRFISLRLGFSWLGRGMYYLPPWPVKVLPVKLGAAAR